jgi:hypothetical protein
VHINVPGGDLRKGILLGLVGGFAGFHLMQAGMAAMRVSDHSFGTGLVKRGADRVDAAISKLGSTFFNAAESGQGSWGLYYKLGSARDNWTRLALTATPGLIKTLVGLMTIATVWDASGVFFNATGMDAGTPNSFKLTTQSINLLNDSILLRLQVRELAKRLTPEMAEGLLKSVLTKLSATPYTLDVLEGLFKNLATNEARVAIIGDNPIGWIVNIGYMATTVANWAYDHNKNVAAFEKFDRIFLEGAGLNHDVAEVMDKHHWWSGDSKADGFVKAYIASGGDPAKFLDYLNHMQPRTLDGVLSVSEHMDDHLDKDDNVPVTQDESAFLALPSDPTKVDVSQYTVISYNGATKRYEDPITQTYWEGGRWIYDPTIGNSMGTTPARKDDLVFYNPARMELMYRNGFAWPVQLTSKSGWENWMRANEIALPAKAPPPSPPSPPVLPPAPPTTAQNVYTVKEGDNVWKIAGNDPDVVQRIYDLNPWLNQRLEDSRSASGHGRNPNLINPGEKIILPLGYKPPEA